MPAEKPRALPGAARALALLAVLGVSQPALGQPPSDPPLSTQQRLDQIEQEIRIMDRRHGIERDSLLGAARRAPRIVSGGEGFGVRSADGKFQLRLRGYFHGDGRFFLNDGGAPAANTFIVRRARHILEATVHQRFDFRSMIDFAEGRVSLFDAYLEARLLPALAARAGKYKPPIGLERLQSGTDLKFAERGLPTNLVPTRDIGLQLSGELRDGLVAYALAVLDGVADLGSGDGDAGEPKDVAARLFIQPFARAGALERLGLGAGASTGTERGTAALPGLAAYRTPGQHTFFRYRSDNTLPNTAVADGDRRRLSPHGYAHVGSLGVLAEYALSSQEVRRDTLGSARLTHRAWQVAGSWFVTGEKASLRGVAPRRAFDPAGRGWGALELAARWGEIRLDPGSFPRFANPANSARLARSWGVGGNWHLARNVKVVVNVERTTFRGGAATGDRAAESFFVTRFQTAF